ncbi:S-4TM family putative pore-forming effector [Clostridium sp. WILCCON 0269]|uniref:S-4TM family putative pore-forming effector n=1 Tax=Candidatus Clostridium eludens TaxID=3381663 RepID=A0ABW8SV42_9CLOT
MNNGIINRENNQENLMKLAAQNYLYSKAKIILGIQIITQVVLVVCIALLPIFITDSFLKYHGIKKIQFTITTVGLSLILAAIDLIVMVPIINKDREIAASIQEDFDCTVLSIPWNDIKVDKPDGEIISSNASEYIKTKLSKVDIGAANSGTVLDCFRDWYSPKTIESLPLEVGRIICQRTNCWWDSYLRNKFKRDIVICSSGIFFLLLLIGIIREMSVPNIIINVFSPFLPVLTFTVVQCRENTRSIKCTKRLKIKADEYWGKVISNPTNFVLLNDLARKLQNEVFDCRKNNPLIFDWYYNKYRREQQRDTNYKAQTMIDQYNSTII